MENQSNPSSQTRFLIAAALSMALVFSAGFFGAKKYDQPKRTAIDRAAAIKKRVWLLGLL